MNEQLIDFMHKKQKAIFDSQKIDVVFTNEEIVEHRKKMKEKSDDLIKKFQQEEFG